MSMFIFDRITCYNREARLKGYRLNLEIFQVNVPWYFARRIFMNLGNEVRQYRVCITAILLFNN